MQKLVSEKEYLEWNVQKVALKLLNILLNDEAILLPALHEEFCDSIRVSISNYPLAQAVLKSIPTTHWLLSSISNHLGDILGVTCKHKKYGTLLYRNGGDLLKAALGKLQQQKKSEPDTTLQQLDPSPVHSNPDKAYKGEETEIQ